jgi:hypothetical protein
MPDLSPVRMVAFICLDLRGVDVRHTTSSENEIYEEFTDRIKSSGGAEAKILGLLPR